MRIALHKGTLVVSKLSPSALQAVRDLPVRRYNAASGSWDVDHVVENYLALAAHPECAAALRDACIPLPERYAHTVDYDGKNLSVKVPPTPGNVEKCKAIPEQRMFRGGTQAWVCKPTPRNVAYLREAFPAAFVTPTARDLFAAAEAAEAMLAGFVDQKAEVLADVPEVTDYNFGTKTTPMSQQLRAFSLSKDRVAFAYLMEQGTGKTAVFIHDACYAFLNGKVEAALVVCPNGVKDNWPEEVEKHAPEYTRHACFVWEAGLKKGDWERMKAARADGQLVWLVMNVEAFSSQKGVEAAELFLATFHTQMGVDESSRIKNHGAKRTKAISKAGRMARRRRILTGTPITQSPLDAYPQFEFLDPAILGFGSFYSFRNYFALMGGFNGKEVVGYANLPELKAKIDPHSYRVLQSECMNLPAVTYTKVSVDLDPEQRKVYDGLKKEMIAEVGGGTVSVTMVLTQMLRLQQVAGGFVALDPDEDGNPQRTVPTPGRNPKLDALMEYVGENPGKTIVWSRFRAEIAIIAAALRAEYGAESVVEFHGGVSSADRTAARHAFQDPDSKVRFFVGQQETGGIGITLTQARHMVFFSNTFKLEDRLQAVKRAERYGMAGTLIVVDLVARKTIDQQVHKALRAKKDLADLITGDDWREWL